MSKWPESPRFNQRRRRRKSRSRSRNLRRATALIRKDYPTIGVLKLAVLATEQYKIMNRLSRQEQIRIFRYLFPIAFVLSLLLYGIFGSKVIWNVVLYLAIATFILRMIRLWLELKAEKKIKKKGM